MKIKLVFDDWLEEGKTIYHTLKGVDLAMSDFHGGSTFQGTIKLNIDQEKELQDALKKGYRPVFWVTQ